MLPLDKGVDLFISLLWTAVEMNRISLSVVHTKEKTASMSMMLELNAIVSDLDNAIDLMLVKLSTLVNY